MVYINTYVNRIDAYSLNVLEVPAGTGSGFVWDDKGHIVTNYHVIRNAETATVTATSIDGKSTRTFRAQANIIQRINFLLKRFKASLLGIDRL